MRDVFPADALGGPRRAAGVRHARRGRLHRRAQRDPAVEGGGLHGARPDLGRAAARHARRQSVSRRDAGVLRRDVARAVARAGAPIEIEAPFAALHKADVIRKGIALGVPLELTLSCMQPKDGLHCGRCSKCRERRDAFSEAGVDDPTSYRHTPIGKRPDGSAQRHEDHEGTKPSHFVSCDFVTFVMSRRPVVQLVLSRMIRRRCGSQELAAGAELAACSDAALAVAIAVGC